MAVPDFREHGQHRASGNKESSEMVTIITKSGTLTGPKSLVEELPRSTDTDDDADVSDSGEDSEDDSEEDSSDDNQEEEEKVEAHSTNVQHPETSVQGGLSTQTSFQEYVRTKNQERKSNKRPAKEDLTTSSLL